MTPQDQPPAPTVAQVITGMRRTVELARQHGGKIDWAYVETWANQLTALQPPPDPPAPTLRALIAKHFDKLHRSLCQQEVLRSDDRPGILGIRRDAVSGHIAIMRGELERDLLALLTETDGPASQEKQ
jgi:hypothetical protein